jgi:hypothetical protein
VYKGAPDGLIEKTRGNVWRIEATHAEFDEINTNYKVITTVPSPTGWDMEVVAQSTNGYPSHPVEPNLEHAYVYYMEDYLETH